MIIDCISDLHGFYPKMPGGDLLIIAGDLTASDLPHQRLQFLEWLARQNYIKKVWIAGNHDNSLEGMNFTPTRVFSAEYLCDSGTEFEGLKIWGSPWTSKFPGINPECCAFTADYDPVREKGLAEKWALIPDQVDILVTHSPSFGNLDVTTLGESVGSSSLWLMSLIVRPKIHIFGHVHEAYGYAKHENGIHLINASHVNERYLPVNKPIRITMEGKQVVQVEEIH